MSHSSADPSEQEWVGEVSGGGVRLQRTTIDCINIQSIDTGDPTSFTTTTSSFCLPSDLRG